MKSAYLIFSVSLFVSAALTGCGEKPSGKQQETMTQGAEGKEYDIKGKVVSVMPEMKMVTLDHEEIPGLMKAMKMEYKVEDPKILEGIKSDDQVQGKLKAKAGSYVITKLEKR